MALRLQCGGFLCLLGTSCFNPTFVNTSWTSSHPPLFVLVFGVFCCYWFGFGRFRGMAPQKRNPSPVFWGVGVFVLFCFLLVYFYFSVFRAPQQPNPSPFFCFWFPCFAALGGDFLGLRETPPSKQNNTTKNHINTLLFIFLERGLCFCNREDRQRREKPRKTKKEKTTDKKKTDKEETHQTQTTCKLEPSKAPTKKTHILPKYFLVFFVFHVSFICFSSFFFFVLNFRKPGGYVVSTYSCQKRRHNKQ